MKAMKVAPMKAMKVVPRKAMKVVKTVMKKANMVREGPRPSGDERWPDARTITRANLCAADLAQLEEWRQEKNRKLARDPPDSIAEEVKKAHVMVKAGLRGRAAGSNIEVSRAPPLSQTSQN